MHTTHHNEIFNNFLLLTSIALQFTVQYCFAQELEHSLASIWSVISAVIFLFNNISLFWEYNTMIILVKQYLYSLVDQTNLNLYGILNGLHLGASYLQQHVVSDLIPSERCNEVDIYNRKRKIIRPFNLYQPNFTMQNSTDSGFGFVMFVIIILTDQKYFPFFFKIWLIGVLYFIYLVWIDWMRIPVVYKIRSQLSNKRERETLDLFGERCVRFEDDSAISINQCTFHIHTVKIVDSVEVTSIIGNNPNGVLDSDSLSAPNTVSSGETALFQLVISHPNRRWSVWRRYEDFHEVYCALHEKYFPSHHSIRYTKLHSLRRLKKLHRSFSTSSGGASSSFYSVGVMDSTVAADFSDDCEDFLEMPFLLKLQYEILSWLKVVQTDLVLGDDDVVSALLRLPSFEKAQMRQANMLSGSTAHRDILRHNFRQSAMRRSSVAVGRLGVHDTYFVVEAEKENILRGYSDDSVDMAAPLATDRKQEQQTVSVPDFFPDGEELEVVSEDGTWSGTNMHNFQWIGMSPAIRAMYTDCSYNHSFRVRGLTYMSDKKKVDAGPSISRFICMDMYRVDVSKYGDRHDHVCSIGRAKRRLQVLTGLPDKPFIFVLNIQLPGDPPVSCVFFFAIPAALDRDDEMCKVRTMFSRYIDIPLSEEGDSLSSSSTTSRSDEAREDVFEDAVEHSTAATSTSNSAKGTAKSWTSDIVWPSVGPENPGVLDKKGFQNMRFKLIPNMVEAPWVVQMAVASTPCILGQKVVQRYFRGARYIETDVHVGSSTIANNIVALCRAYSKVFICNIGVVLQGECPEELPERLLACATLVRVDTDLAGSIEE